MINLNKPFVSKQLLLKYINDYDVYAKYIIHDEILVGKNILSPFRNEHTPSFGFFIGESGEICFNDFKLRLKGDCIKFVQILFDLTYFEALSKIAIDFDMEDDFIVKKSNIQKTTGDFTVNTSRENALSKTLYKFTLGKKKRDWELYDLEYWKDFGISLETLCKYNVEPISYFLVNGKPIKADKHAYVFIETKDNVETYKIYQPFSKDYKWINSHNESIWQGWSQLPKTGDTLFITKSLKDVMSIKDILGYDAVALQSENVIPKKHIFEELENRFNNIIIFYDNDYDKEENWGQIFSKRLADFTGCFEFFLPEEYGSKDFSDLVKNYGKNAAKEIFEKELITPPF